MLLSIHLSPVPIGVQLPAFSLGQTSPNTGETHVGVRITHRIFKAIFTDLTSAADRFRRSDVARLLIKFKREPPLQRLPATFGSIYPIANLENVGQHGNDHGVQPHCPLASRPLYKSHAKRRFLAGSFMSSNVQPRSVIHWA